MDLDQVTSDFLGLAYTNDHRRLLGLPNDRSDEVAIDVALRRRLAQLHVHPRSRSEDAAKVRSYLRRIADDYKNLASKRINFPNENPPDLTPLDQSILAVLISGGGWNAQSRARLVMVAASYSITVGGLMRILEALAESARSGEGPLSRQCRSTYVMDRSWTTIPVKKSNLSIVDEFLSQAAKKLTPELHSPTPVMTFKLAVLFGLLTLFALVLSVRVLLHTDPISTSQQGVVSADRNSNLPDDDDVVTTDQFISLFAQYPTFRDSGLESTCMEFADHAVTAPQNLSTLALAIRDTLTRGAKAEELWKTLWDQTILNVSHGWPHVDNATLRAVSDSMVDVLFQSQQQPALVESFLEPLELHALDVNTPFGPLQSAWANRMLTRIHCDQRLSPSTRASARSMQLDSSFTCNEIEAMTISLDHSIEELVKMTEFDSRIFTLWEAWLIGVRQMQSQVSLGQRHVLAMEHLLESGVDLSRESNSRKVLGRIIAEAPWSKDAAMIDHLLQLYRSKVTRSEDLWVLGHLLIANGSIPWFTTSYIVQPTTPLNTRKTLANVIRHNRHIQDSPIISTWNLPVPAGFDPSIVQTWQDHFQEFQQEQFLQPVHIASLRLLNQAAVGIWRGRTDAAVDALRALENFEDIFRDGTQRFHVPVNNVWTLSIVSNAGRREARINLIDSLIESGATELDADNASMLASAALNDPITNIRVAAIELIINQFSNSRTVAVALLHRLESARSKQHVAKLVANLTETVLPDVHDSRWEVDAHRALVQHAISAGRAEHYQLDIIANELSRSLISELRLMDPSMLPLSGEVPALTAIQMLVDVWRNQVSSMQLQHVEAQFNPTGVLQEYLLFQLEYLRFLQLDEMKWRSQEPYSIQSQLIDEFEGNPSSIVDQIAQAEFSIAQFWNRILSDLIREHSTQQQPSP